MLLAGAGGSLRTGRAGTAGCSVQPLDEQFPVACKAEWASDANDQDMKHGSKMSGEHYTKVCLDLQFSFSSAFCSGEAGSGRNSESAERSYAFSFF